MHKTENISRPIRSRRNSEATNFARTLRQGGNAAEAVLWISLKGKRLGGHKFVRQFPIGKYFADFLCRSRALVVEVDGSQHVGKTSDRERDEFMRSAGYSVIRFWSADVLRNTDSVCDTILTALNGQLTLDIVASDLRFVFSERKE